MKKFIFSLIFGFVTLMSFTSCASPAYAQAEVYDNDSDVSVVIRYGTPYYYNGSLLYYMYDGFYYYPYLRNNRYYYYYRYTKPLPPPRGGRHFEPRHHDKPHFEHHKRSMPMRSSTYRNHQPPRNHSNFGGHRGGFNRGGGVNHGNRHFGGRR